MIASAFDSAGQRCSALRILCLQEDIAERTLAMLQGRDGGTGGRRSPAACRADVGPVITAEARDGILEHIEAMRARGFTRHARLPLPAEAAHGTFVAPTLIEIGRIADVEREVFGPVLHVLRYRRADLDRLIDEINATGYGLTFGLHTRIDETIARVVGAGRGRQHLCQPQHHRRRGRRAAVRRLRAFRHRAEGGRPALSLPPARARRRRMR